MNTCKWIFKLSKYVDKYKHKASRYLGQEEHTCGSNFNPWRLQICLTCHIESSWIPVPYKSFKQKISKNHKTLDIHSTNNAIFAILGPLSFFKFCQITKNCFFPTTFNFYLRTVKLKLFASQVFPSTKRPWSFLFPSQEWIDLCYI